MELNEGLKIIGEAAFGYSAIKSITLPSTLEKLCKEAFYGCKKLKTVVLNDGLKEIEEFAFWGTALKIIRIPKSVERIDSGALYKVKHWERINCELTKKYVNENKDKFEGLLEEESKINWLNG